MPERARPTQATSAGVLTWAEIKPFFANWSIDTYLRPLPQHDVIYVKNPKAACSSLLTWLNRIHTGEHDLVVRNVHKNHRLPHIQEVGRRRVTRMLSGGAYRFSFVRNPLGRFESVYWDKMTHDLRWRRRNIPKTMGLPADPDEPVSFEQFLGAVEGQDPLTEMDPHWRPQHLNLMHPLVTYDHVGRLESFDADLEHIREEAGLPRVPIQARNTSKRTSSDSVYDGRPDLVKRVEGIFATDFDLYGY
jgi:Sulfotransferase family